MADDVYNDPDNILANDTDTSANSAELPADERDDPSQSIYNPERDDPNDDRGPIDELEPTNADGNEPSADPERDQDEDADKLGDMDPVDERDGTE